MSNKIQQVQLKRSNKTLQQLDTSSTTLLYGEPLVLPSAKMLVIGDSDETNTVSNDLVISMTSSDLANKELYFDGTNILDSSGNAVTLPSDSVDQSSKLDKTNPEASGTFELDGNQYVSGDVYVQSNLSTPTGSKVATQTSITAAWVSGSQYKLGAIVYYQDKLYRCIQANTAGNSTLPTNTSYWVPLQNISIQDLTFSSAGDGASSGSTYSGSVARKISYNSIGAASSTHTHNYAGSTSAGGASTQLNVNSTTSGTYYILGAQSTGAQNVYRAYNANGSVNNSGVRFDAATGVLYGAAWNDFAEFRKVQGDPGTVVCEFGNGHLFVSNARLLPGAAVISDTFGMVVGEESSYTEPVAVAGRVLAKVNPKENYEVGDCVCSGENGTISKMTRREIRKYPDRIVGIVSEIPDYEEWNGVKVNNRIWIKVR